MAQIENQGMTDHPADATTEISLGLPYGIGIMPPMTFVDHSGCVFSLRDFEEATARIAQRLGDQSEPERLVGLPRTIRAFASSQPTPNISELSSLWTHDRLSNAQWREE